MFEALYLILPLLLKGFFPKSRFADVAIMVFLWGPIELGWLKLWYLPVLGAAEIVVMYQYLWPLPQPWRLGWRWALTSKDILTALGTTTALAVVIVPSAFALHFVRWNPSWLSPTKVGLIFVFALIEEILFRGFIQNFLEKGLKNSWLALGITAVVFGMSHVNNSSTFASAPNWKYVILATMAGTGYGLVWLKTRSVVASSIIHSLVNILWKGLFLG